MASLFVLLPEEPVTDGTEFHFVLSTDGRSLARTGYAAAPLLPAATGAGSEVVAVVPASRMSWHRVDWPRSLPAGSSRLRAALEGLLEEQLLDEPEAVHFALEPGARAGTGAWVAACDRGWLRAALNALEIAGRHPARVVPEVAPEAPAGWLATGEPDAAWLIARGPAGVQRVPLGPGVTDLLPATGADDALLLAEPAVSALAEACLQRPAVLQTPAQRWLQAAQSRWDLAQFDLARSARTRWLRRSTAAFSTLWRTPEWRPARWALGVLLVAQLAGLNAWAWMERQSLDAKRLAVRDTLTATFPQVRVVVDAPAQMEREVSALRQATGAPAPADLESLLGALARLPEAGSVTDIDYANGQLRLRGTGGTSGAWQAAAPALRNQGLVAQLQGEWLQVKPEGLP